MPDSFDHLWRSDPRLKKVRHNSLAPEKIVTPAFLRAPRPEPAPPKKAVEQASEDELPSFPKLPPAVRSRRTGKFTKVQGGPPFVNFGMTAHPAMLAGFRRMATLAGVPLTAVWRAAALRGASRLLRDIRAGRDISGE
jgi:hypothetical protein